MCMYSEGCVYESGIWCAYSVGYVCMLVRLVSEVCVVVGVCMVCSAYTVGVCKSGVYIQ